MDLKHRLAPRPKHKERAKVTPRAALTRSSKALRSSAFAVLESLEQRQFLAATEPVINEFMASNQSGITDNFGQNSDWIEIHNPTASPVNLTGWHLSNDISDPTEWAFPNVTLNPNQYLIVWATDRNLRDPAQPLHTNFKLDAGGDFLALYRPDGTASTEFRPTYPEQLQDTSYGRSSTDTYQYMTSETPGAANINGADGTVADTSFSVDRGFFDAPFSLTISTLTPGATIRYTTNGSTPTLTNGITYSGPININTTSIVRAAAFRTGWISSNVDTQSYIFLQDVLTQPNLKINSITRSGSVATVTTALPHGFASGASVNILGANEAAYNGNFIVNVTGPSTFSYNIVGAPATPATGTYLRIGNPPGYPTVWSQPSGSANADYEMDPEVVNDPLYRDRMIEALTSLPSLSLVMPINDLFNNTNGPNGTGGIYTHSQQVDADVPLRSVTSIHRTGTTATVTAISHGYVNGDQIWIHNANQAAYNGVFTISNVTASTFTFQVPATTPTPATGTIFAQRENNVQLWERPGSVEYLNADGSSGFQTNAGIQVQGGASREPAKSGKHSFRLLFKAQYGASKLNYDLFEDSPVDEFDTLILKAGFNMSWIHGQAFQRERALMVHDSWMSDTQLDMGSLSKHGRYVHLYVNGMYWGVHDLMERPENSFAASHLGGPAEDYDVINNENQLLDGNQLAWNQMFNIANQGLASQANYNAIKTYLDIPAFIDYMILNFYGGNMDWDDHNWYAARRSRVDGVPANVDQFHFFSYDAENTLGGVADNIIAGNRVMRPTALFHALRNNAEFRLLFADRIHKHLFNDGALTPTANMDRFRKLIDEVDPAVIAESARWGDYRLDVNLQCAYGAGQCDPRALYTRDNQWMTEQNRLLTQYFPVRTLNMIGQFRANQLYPNMDAPEFNKLGGEVSSGFALNMHANTGGIIYYTLDGTDPRLVGGAVAPGALTYTGPVAMSSSARVLARAFNPTTNTWSAITDYTFHVVPTPRLAISEIMYNPLPQPGSELDDDEYQFIELENTGNVPINLQGIILKGVGDFVFPDLQLFPGARTLVVANRTAFEDRYGTGLPIAGEFTGRLSHNGETLTLLTPLGHIIQTSRYSDGWYGPTDGDGYSLVAVDSGDFEQTAKEAWRPSSVLHGGPGVVDPGLDNNAIVINEVLFNTAGDPWIEFRNQTGDDIDIGGWYLTNDPLALNKYIIPSGTIVPANNYLRLFQSATFGTAFQLNPAGGELRLSNTIGVAPGSYRDGVDFGASDPEVSFGRYIKSTGGSDFAPLASATPGAANAAPRVGPIVINEIMYNPANAADEYIEIKNISGSTVALHDGTNGWAFTTGITFAFPVSSSLLPGEIALIVPIDPAVFRTRYSVPALVKIFGPYTGVLSDNGERLALGKPNTSALLPYIEVDRVNYNDAGSWPPDAKGRGASLHRKVDGAYSNDAANWGPSRAGGTPGVSNLLVNAPIVNAGPDTTINEGQTFTYTGSFVDPDAGDTWTATVYWGDSAIPQVLTLNANKTFNLSHAYPDNGRYTVIVTVTDGGKLVGTDSVVVNVNVSNPTVTAVGGNPVNENVAGSVRIRAIGESSLPDLQNGFSYHYDYNNDGIFDTVYAVNNVRIPISGLVRNNNVVTVTTSTAHGMVVGDGVIIVGATPASFNGSWIVASVPTSTTFTFAQTAPNEAATVRGTYTPPFNVTVPANHMDGPGTRQIRIRVVDKDGGYGDFLANITVNNNNNPNAIFTNGGSVVEGATTATVNFSGQSDVLADLASLRYSYDFDNDGVFDLGNGTYAGSAGVGASAQVPAALLAESGSRVIRGRVMDKDGGVNNYVTTLIVTNVAPTATATNSGSTPEGSASATVSFSNQADTAGDVAAGFTYSYDFDNNGVFELTAISLSSVNVPSQYLSDGPGNRTVRMRIIDRDGGFRDYTTSIPLTNVAPTIGAINNVVVGMGSPLNVAGSVSDPGADTFTGTIEYGNGAAPQPLTINPDGTFTINGVYNAPGQYTATVRVSDDDGGAATPLTFNVNVRGSALQGSAGVDNYYIRLDSSQANVEFYEGFEPPSTPTFVIPLSSLTNISIDSQGDADVVVIDLINGSPIPSGGLTFTANSQNVNAGDKLIIFGDGTTDVLNAPSTTAYAGTLTLGSRTVTYAGLGEIEIDSAASYKLTTPTAFDSLGGAMSPDAITITGNSGAAQRITNTDTITFDLAANDNGVQQDWLVISGNAGTQVLNLAINAGTGPNSLAFTATGTFNLDTSPGIGGVNLDLEVQSNATVNFAESQRLKSLEFAGRVNLAGSGKLLQVASLSRIANGTLDLDANDMIVRSANPQAQLTQMAGWLNSARNGSATKWGGSGIASTAAANDPLRITGLAAILNRTAGGAAIHPTFAGQSVDANSVLVKYSYEGDANVDGRLDADDYAAIDNGYATAATGYQNGDFDYSGLIDADDYFTIDRAHFNQGAPLSTPLAPAEAPLASEPVTPPPAEPEANETPAEPAPTVIEPEISEPAPVATQPQVTEPKPVAPTRAAKPVATPSPKKSKHHRRQKLDRDDRVWNNKPAFTLKTLARVLRRS